jgi:hypothetical protein
MQTGKIGRFVKVAVASAIIFAGILVVPYSMDTPARNIVQAMVVGVTGNDNLFPREGNPLLEVIARSFENPAGKTDQEKLRFIVRNVISTVQPGFQGALLANAVDHVVDSLTKRFPSPFDNSTLLAGPIGSAIQEAISFALGKMPPRYPDLTPHLFKKSTWQWITAAAMAFGTLALLVVTFWRIASPQDEAKRTRIVNVLITWPGLIVALGLLNTYLSPLLMNSVQRNALFASTSTFAATLIICAAFLLLAIFVYIVIALGITLLPYFAERVSILAVWRRLFIPPLINWTGEALHQLQADAIVKRVIKILFDHFAEEPAK